MARMESTAEVLALHGLRLRGHGDAMRIAERFGLDAEDVAELMLDFEAHGWVSRVAVPGPLSWSLTQSGRVANERMLAAELDRAGVRDVVTDVHRAFLPLNARFQRACTDWQVRPEPGGRLTSNDHTDFNWDDRVLGELRTLGSRLNRIGESLARSLERFAGYPERYRSAWAKVEAGEYAWVDGVGIDSCHAVWFELHEDLLATLGIERGTEE